MHICTCIRPPGGFLSLCPLKIYIHKKTSRWTFNVYIHMCIYICMQMYVCIEECAFRRTSRLMSSSKKFHTLSLPFYSLSRRWYRGERICRWTNHSSDQILLPVYMSAHPALLLLSLVGLHRMPLPSSAPPLVNIFFPSFLFLFLSVTPKEFLPPSSFSRKRNIWPVLHSALSLPMDDCEFSSSPLSPFSSLHIICVYVCMWNEVCGMKWKSTPILRKVN